MRHSAPRPVPQGTEGPSIVERVPPRPRQEGLPGLCVRGSFRAGPPGFLLRWTEVRALPAVEVEPPRALGAGAPRGTARRLPLTRPQLVAYAPQGAQRRRYGAWPPSTPPPLIPATCAAPGNALWGVLEGSCARPCPTRPLSILEAATRSRRPAWAPFTEAAAGRAAQDGEPRRRRAGRRQKWGARRKGSTRLCGLPWLAETVSPAARAASVCSSPRTRERKSTRLRGIGRTAAAAYAIRALGRRRGRCRKAWGDRRPAAVPWPFRGARSWWRSSLVSG